jgi:hypothetical protein
MSSRAPVEVIAELDPLPITFNRCRRLQSRQTATNTIPANTAKTTASDTISMVPFELWSLMVPYGVSDGRLSTEMIGSTVENVVAIDLTTVVGSMVVTN